jgi:hypothetical protein
MRMSGAPQILAQWVLHIGGVTNKKGKYAHATNHHGGQDDQEHAGQKARFVGHDHLHSFEKLAAGPEDVVGAEQETDYALTSSCSGWYHVGWIGRSETSSSARQETYHTFEQSAERGTNGVGEIELGLLGP